MSGNGIYIWEAYYNNTMSVPSINAFYGSWEKGQRHGYGILHLGLGLGSHYKGEFKRNKKHGVGKFVTNNGFILQDKNLFIEDNIAPAVGTEARYVQEAKKAFAIVSHEPHKFDICDNNVGLIYHVDQAFKNLDKRAEIRKNIIMEFMENNNILGKQHLGMGGVEETASEEALRKENFDTLIMFEETSLRNCLKCYETELVNIYYKYATICNTEEIEFTPILIRLYLWQLYYDCNVHERGLTLVEIDRIYHRNPEWLARSAHNPFEKVYFWQFLHSIISVASRLYAKRQMPGPKPDTIIASALRNFMDLDVIPGTSQHKGRSRFYYLIQITESVENIDININFRLPGKWFRSIRTVKSHLRPIPQFGRTTHCAHFPARRSTHAALPATSSTGHCRSTRYVLAAREERLYIWR